MKSNNRALTIQIRYEPAPVIPLKQEGSLLDWLNENNRIIYREEKAQVILPLEDEEFDLIDGEEVEFDLDLDVEVDLDDDTDDDLD